MMTFSPHSFGRLCSTTTRRRALLLSLAALLIVLVTQIALAGAAAKSHTAKKLAAVPQGFAGVDLDGPLFDPASTLDLSNQMTKMVSNGVQSVRVAFSWGGMQPYASWSDVPPADRDQFSVSGTVPTDFSTTDTVVGNAALHGLTVLPTLLYAPTWDSRRKLSGTRVPKRVGPFATYCRQLVNRYGPNGSFWSENPQIPKHPIRAWQIWNEPNLDVYWTQPFANTYVALVKAAHAAIKKADPGAKIVLGALTNLAWKAFAQINHVKGSRGTFNIVAVNGFTESPTDVIRYYQLMRRTLNHFKYNRTPLLPTEISWPSGKGQASGRNDFNVTQKGEARNLAALLPMIGANRQKLGLAGFYWYTWVGNEMPGNPVFSFAGLLRYQNGTETAKPALAAYRRGALTLERCRAKGSTANVCLH
jgi:hypothetical protein